MKTRKLLALSWVFASAGCGPLAQPKKVTHEKMAKTMAQGRRVAALPVAAEFQLAQPSVDGGPSLDGPASKRQVAFSLQSGIAEWVLVDPSAQIPLSGQANAAELRKALLDEIAFHGSDYGLTEADLDASARLIELSDRLVSVSLGRHFQGIPVRDSLIQGIFWRDDQGLLRLREVVNLTHGPVVLRVSQAESSSWEDLRQVLPDDSIIQVGMRRVILPFQTVDPGSSQTNILYSLATEFVFKKPDQEATFTVTLEDGTLQMLEAFSSEYRVAMPLHSTVYKRSYLDSEPVTKVLSETPVLIQNNSVTSDIDGQVDIGAATSIQIRLQGKRVQVLPRQGNAPILVTTTPALVNGKQVVTSTGDNLAAMNTYTSMLEVNQFTRRHLSDGESRFLSAATAARINVRGSCNAFYDGAVSAISLFAAGNGCANVALINDVIYHEWGHGLDNFTGVNVGITDGAFSEAIGDIISAYLTGSPVTAPGFLLNDPTGIRKLDNQKKYPADLQNEVHADGEIVGGAFWRMRQAMISRYGANGGAVKAEGLFFRHLLSTDSYLQSYQSVLRLDDNDGNPMTKSPNHCLINTSFAAHGLATDENCQDDATPSSVPVDVSASIGILASNDQGITLMASSEKGKKMSYCFGTKEVCLAQETLQVPMTVEGVQDQKVIFVTKDPINLKPLATVTLIVKGADDKAIGTKSFKLSLK